MATYRTSVAGGSSTGTSNRTVVITPAVGDLLVLFVSLSDNTSSTITVTDNNGSGTYYRVGNALWNTSVSNLAVFVREALMTNTTSTTITCNSGSNTAGVLVAVAISGMSRKGQAAIRSSGSQANQAASTIPAPVLNQNALTSNVTLAAVASGDTTTTEASGWTERQDSSQTSPATSLEVCTRDSGFTGTTITFGATQSTTFASFAIELDGSAMAYTLSCVSGPLNVTGTDANLEYGHKVQASSGPYTFSGTAADLEYGHKVQASSGSVAISGTDASLRSTRRLSAASDQFVVTGTAAVLKKGHPLAAQSGSYTVTGADADLTHESAGGYLLTADGGSVATSGTPTSFTSSRRLFLESGSFSTTGQVTTLKATRLLTPDFSTVSVSGGDVSLYKGRTLVGEAGSYSTSGGVVTFSAGKALAASGGSFSLEGADASLRASRLPLVGAGGAIQVSGQAVGLKAGRGLQVSPIPLVITGYDVELINITVFVSTDAEGVMGVDPGKVTSAVEAGVTARLREPGRVVQTPEPGRRSRSTAPATSFGGRGV